MGPSDCIGASNPDCTVVVWTVVLTDSKSSLETLKPMKPVMPHVPHARQRCSCWVSRRHGRTQQRHGRTQQRYDRSPRIAENETRRSIRQNRRQAIRSACVSWSERQSPKSQVPLGRSVPKGPEQSTARKLSPHNVRRVISKRSSRPPVGEIPELDGRSSHLAAPEGYHNSIFAGGKYWAASWISDAAKFASESGADDGQRWCGRAHLARETFLAIIKGAKSARTVG
jgi:hypothetical protein